MLVVAALTVSLAAVACAWILASTETLLKRRTRRRCLVSCKDGQTFSGLLWEADKGCLVLKAATVVGDGGTASIDGEVVILRADVAFIQVP